MRQAVHTSKAPPSAPPLLSGGPRSPRADSAGHGNTLGRRPIRPRDHDPVPPAAPVAFEPDRLLFRAITVQDLHGRSLAQFDQEQASLVLPSFHPCQPRAQQVAMLRVTNRATALTARGAWLMSRHACQLTYQEVIASRGVRTILP